MSEQILNERDWREIRALTLLAAGGEGMDSAYTPAEPWQEAPPAEFFVFWGMEGVHVPVEARDRMLAAGEIRLDPERGYLVTGKGRRHARDFDPDLYDSYTRPPAVLTKPADLDAMELAIAGFRADAKACLDNGDQFGWIIWTQCAEELAAAYLPKQVDRAEQIDLLPAPSPPVLDQFPREVSQ